MDTKKGLTNQERKKLITDLAVKIAPSIIEKSKNSDEASEWIAIYSNSIADALNSILIDPSGKSL